MVPFFACFLPFPTRNFFFCFFITLIFFLSCKMHCYAVIKKCTHEIELHNFFLTQYIIKQTPWLSKKLYPFSGDDKKRKVLAQEETDKGLNQHSSFPLAVCQICYEKTYVIIVCEKSCIGTTTKTFPSLCNKWPAKIKILFFWYFFFLTNSESCLYCSRATCSSL